MFGDVLRQLRKEQNISQDELAKKIGISKSTIGMYEQGNRMPKADKTLTAIAEYFNVTLDYLLDIDNSVDCMTSEIEKLYNQLDSEDKAEIRGIIRGMLLNDKYKKGLK